MRVEQALRQRVGARIRQQRETRKLSQTALAAKARIGRITLIRIETGTQDPTLTTLARLARALGVRLRDLLPPS
jgi:transcriptional regulator with XRE-family HTH domain